MEHSGKIDIELIRKELLHWFENSQRYFPWRQTKNPYKIIIAEKLLQQTKSGELVVNAYNEIIIKYPTPNELATANLNTLKKIIRPLGFIFRAKQLKQMANELVNSHGGNIPNEYNDLMMLTGIGEYCSNAVLSFAFCKDVPIVDTNVGRFIHRVYGLEIPVPANPARNKYLRDLALELLPLGKSKEFNLAILDLCNAYCKSGTPFCNQCPLKNICRYGIQNNND